ncbi:hypothetical protein CY34DRAFT_802670 [Suillus luteus UH-Slu-Lm8-n1]|uniref:Uncharacterized protein n=1 Tax=Suillus luteus UH-Slu-Lm8-n1 TaxID=930992 RepID=A0A0D0A3B2_9AGAM|nr:hypothetical protein CY34DRAFT_802670 [Suillus luteus UH-Slu-Lm8-n1]
MHDGYNRIGEPATCSTTPDDPTKLSSTSILSLLVSLHHRVSTQDCVVVIILDIELVLTAKSGSL